MVAGQARQRRTLLLGASACVAGLVFWLATSGGSAAKVAPGAGGVWHGSGAWRYLTVVDAGSSGCRAHVFRWRGVDGGRGVEIDPKHNNLKVKPGLSSFAANPAGAGASLKPMLDFVLGEIPQDQWATSPIFLKATAGLRMTAEGPRKQILESVRDALAASPLQFDDREAGALVIEGTDEGGYGWMSVNYLMGNLAGDATPSDFVGVVEMGGASAQVTQYATEPVPEGYEFKFRLGSRKYSLYTHSYLGYGLEQARETLSKHLKHQKHAEIVDPCLNAGFAKKAAEKRQDVYDGPRDVDMKGTGDAGPACGSAIEKALFSLDGSCAHGSCSFDPRVYQPKDLPTSKLLAFENFYYTAAILGIKQTDLAPKDFTGRGAAEACGIDWAALQASDMPRDGSPKDELNKICFSANYLGLFLEKGVGVGAGSNVKVMQQVGEFGIDWSLGAAIHEASELVK